jgi:hypothetical protein
MRVSASLRTPRTRIGPLRLPGLAALSHRIGEQLFLFNQHRRLRRIAASRQETADPAALLATVRRMRLVFTVTAGRTGTTYLTRLFALLPDTVSLHEPQPSYVYFLRQVTQFREPRRWVAPDDRLLTLDAWLPAASGALYAFSAPAAPLRPLYERLLGAERVTSFGDAFTVRVEPGDWAWLRAHGWLYQLRCGDVGRRAQVPALHQMNMGFAALDCEAPATHTWVGRWVGPPTRLRLRARSALVVKTPRETLDTLGDEQPGPPFELEIEVQPGDHLRIQTTTPAHQPWSDLAVWERAHAGERLPAWESVVPP